jgi:hypothetical protein
VVNGVSVVNTLSLVGLVVVLVVGWFVVFVVGGFVLSSV